MNKEVLKEIAVKAAFYNMDFCPGTGFYEVLDDVAMEGIVKEAQLLIDSLGVSVELIDEYIVAYMLWGMSQEIYDAEVAKWNS